MMVNAVTLRGTLNPQVRLKGVLTLVEANKELMGTETCVNVDVLRLEVLSETVPLSPFNHRLIGTYSSLMSNCTWPAG